MPTDRPDVPLAEFRSAAGDEPNAHRAIEDFHAAYAAEAPTAAHIEQHADRVRSHPNIVAAFERWYLDTRVQAFIAELTATGI